MYGMVAICYVHAVGRISCGLALQLFTMNGLARRATRARSIKYTHTRARIQAHMHASNTCTQQCNKPIVTDLDTTARRCRSYNDAYIHLYMVQIYLAAAQAAAIECSACLYIYMYMMMMVAAATTIAIDCGNCDYLPIYQYILYRHAFSQYIFTIYSM